MPKPSDAKVWNEDLVRGLEMRADHARQLGQPTHLRWSEGARAIRSVRKDIYAFNNGRIVGLPKDLKVTVSNEVRAIIQGERPIKPEGYIPTNGDFAFDESFTNDPYLQKIKCNGGAFAILLAFHFSNKETMTKSQVCSEAQPFCDDAMEPNFMAGRSHGAWSAIKTLVKHDFIHENRTNARFEDNSWRSNGCWTWTITSNGKKFTKALMNKFNITDDGSGQNAYSANYHGAGGSMGAGRRSSGGRFSLSPQRAFKRGIEKSVNLISGSSSVKKASSRTNELHESDRAELLAWLKNANPREQKRFKIGKQRRQMLHNLCDDLMQKYSGLVLIHSSDGVGNDRALFITVMRKDCILSDERMKPNVKSFQDTVSAGGLLQSDARMSFSAFISPASAAPSAPAAAPFACAGHTLSAGSPKKKLRMDNVPASVLAADAALNRQAWQNAAKIAKREKQGPSSRAQRLTLAEAVDLLNSESDDDDLLNDERKPAAVRKTNVPAQTQGSKSKSTKMNGKGEVVVLIDESDGEDETMKKLAANRGAKAKNELENNGSSDEPIQLDDSQDCIQPCNLDFDINEETKEPLGSQKTGSRSQRTATDAKPQLIILIDDRERDRNATPRQLRMDLMRQASTGLLKRVWPMDMPEVKVQERRLVYGDFAFELDKNAYVQLRIPLTIERKRVSDLVQRSHKGDHWNQLHRMCGHCDVAVFLIEGDTGTAGQFASQCIEEWKPQSYAIGDEKGVFLFAGRAILTSRKARFVQTKDEQSSLRAVAAHGLMASLSPVAQREVNTSSFNSKAEKTKLADRLLAGGIPWKLARRVSEEIGSAVSLDKLYETASGPARGTLLCPMIANSLPDFANSVTSAAEWSRAIYSIWTSCIPDQQAIRATFEEHKLIVQDQGKMLSALHSGLSLEASIDAALSTARFEDSLHRKVEIQLPSDLEHCFPHGANGADTFYRLTVVSKNPFGLSLPTLVMQTTAAKLTSCQLFVHVITGNEVIDLIEKAMNNEPLEFVSVARDAAVKINKKCLSSQMDLRADQRVIVVHGLNAAREQVAKKAGYRQELAVVVDMVLAELSVAHDVVVLQAMKKKVEHLEMVVQQLALACYNYQLLTRER